MGVETGCRVRRGHMVVNSFDGLACDRLGANRAKSVNRAKAANRSIQTIEPIQPIELIQPKEPIKTIVPIQSANLE